jgi:hypothetical protein
MPDVRGPLAVAAAVAAPSRRRRISGRTEKIEKNVFTNMAFF